MAVSASKFVQTVNQIHSDHKVVYRNGASGQRSNGTWYCDCRGLILWALRLLGASASSSGTNWMIRNQMTSVSRVDSASQLTVGQVVFKSRASTAKLPDKYKTGGAAYDADFGELDVYHVGIVVQTSPSLIIRHCTSGGIKTDTSLGAWCWAGWVEWVTPDDASTTEDDTEQTATVTAPSGKTVNLRRSASKSSTIRKRVPIGETVSILSWDEDWARIRYDGITGYMMTAYLERG